MIPAADKDLMLTTLYKDHAMKNVTTLVIILFVGILLMGVKFVTWYLTDSNAILTDALESIINVVAGSFALFSLILAAKPRDRNHPYGHGKIEYLSAGFEGALIVVAGLSIIGKAAYNFLHPQVIHQLDIGLILTAVTGGINYGMGAILESKGRKSESITMIASGRHLKSDAYSSLGLIVGLGLVMLTRWYALDNVIAVIFGLIILWTGYNLLRKSVAGVMDEADYELITDLVEILDRERRDNWIDIHHFRMVKYGAALHIDCHMTLPWYFDNRESHREVKKMEALINEHCHLPAEVSIHVDPCTPKLCEICQVQDCPERAHPFRERIRWTLENAMENKQHARKN